MASVHLGLMVSMNNLTKQHVTSTLVEALDHQFDRCNRSSKKIKKSIHRCSQKFVPLGRGFNFGLCLGLWLRQAFHRFCSLFASGDGTGEGLGRFHQSIMVTSRSHASLQTKDGVRKGIFYKNWVMDNEHGMTWFHKHALNETSLPPHQNGQS